VPDELRKFGLFPAQKQFLKVEKGVTLDISIYQGGYGSGKTFIGAIRGLLLACKYKGSLGVVVASTKEQLKDSTLLVYFQVLEMFGFKKDIDFKWNQQRATLTFPKWKDSKIFFRSMQYPERLKSITATWIHGEEISELTESNFNLLFSRVRDPRFVKRYLFGTTNPQATKGWIFKHFVERKNKKEIIVDEDGNEEIIHYRRVIASTAENKALSPTYVASMAGQYDPDYFNIFVMGMDGDYTAGLVCKNFSDANLLATPYRPDLSLYLGCDFNVDPMCWMVFHRFNGEFHYIDEICMENTTTVEATDEFHSRYEGHTAGVVLTGDASGQSRKTQGDKKRGTTDYDQIRNRLSELGWVRVSEHLKRGNPPIHNRIAAFNGLICDRNGYRRVYINPAKCPRFIWNMRNLKFIEGTSQVWYPTIRDIKNNKDMKFYGHPWDGGSYVCEMLHPIKINKDALTNSHRIVSVEYDPR